MCAVWRRSFNVEPVEPVVVPVEPVVVPVEPVKALVTLPTGLQLVQGYTVYGFRVLRSCNPASWD